MSDVSPEMIVTATTLVVGFLYILKRLCAFDLEVRAHRERERARLIYAQDCATHAAVLSERDRIDASRGEHFRQPKLVVENGRRVRSMDAESGGIHAAEAPVNLLLERLTALEDPMAAVTDAVAEATPAPRTSVERGVTSGTDVDRSAAAAHRVVDLREQLVAARAERDRFDARRQELFEQLKRAVDIQSRQVAAALAGSVQNQPREVAGRVSGEAENQDVESAATTSAWNKGRIVRTDIPTWALALLDPLEADRCALEWAAHLHERIADGELRAARGDRRRFVCAALVLAVTRRAHRVRRRSR